MNKLEIAKNINCKDDLARVITIDRELNLTKNAIYDNRGKIESWMGTNSTGSFIPENKNKYTYVFYCDNVPCHTVNYEDEEECKILDCENCENEGECLVLPFIKMKIVDVGTDEDLKEMGYIPVYLELI